MGKHDDGCREPAAAGLLGRFPGRQRRDLAQADQARRRPTVLDRPCGQRAHRLLDDPERLSLCVDRLGSARRCRCSRRRGGVSPSQRVLAAAQAVECFLLWLGQGSRFTVRGLPVELCLLSQRLLH
eukprot:Amastigsp_a842120_8.p2 type:complete len:126 gc:universal Amastigsp_a842120_8:592-215(-)